MTFPASSSEIDSTLLAPSRSAGIVARLVALAAALLFSLAPLHAQALQQTVNVGGYPNGFAVDPVYNQIYVANAGGGLSVIDGTTGAVTLTIAGDPTVTAYAVGIDTVNHIIYVVDHGSNKVNTFAAATPNVGASFINSIPTGNGPWSVAVDPVLHQAYVTNNTDGTVTIVSGTSQTTATVTVGSNPQAVAVNPETHQVFVANRSISSTDGTVSVINGNTNAIVANTPLAVGSQPVSIAINTSTNMIYVACVNGAGAEVVQIVGSSVGAVSYVPAALASSGGSPESIAINPITDQVYVLNVGTSVAIYNFENNANPTPTIVTVGSEANYIAVDVVTNIAYTANGGGSVSFVNGNSLTATTLTVPGALQAVAVNPVTHRAYAANYTSPGTVAIIDGDFNSVALFGFDNTAPAYLAIDPVKNMLYVASAIGEVDAVNLSTNTQAYTQQVPTSPTGLLVDPIQDLVYELDANSGLAILTPGASSFTLGFESGSGTDFSQIAENQVTGTVFFASNDGVINYFRQATSSAVYLNGFVPNPTGLVANPATGQVYGVSSTSIYDLDPASNTFTNNSLPEGAVGVVLNPATNTLYASTASGDILVINGATLASTQVLHPGYAAVQGAIAINTVTNQIYILDNDPSSPTLTQMDGTSHTITNIPLAAVGVALAINPTTNKIYVTASNSDNIYVIDGLSQQVLATVNPSQAFPVAAAVNPATNTAYIYNSGAEYVGSAISEFQTAGVGTVATANGVTGSNSLTTVIQPFSSNTTATEEPEFTFIATSSLSFTPDAVLYQVDTWQGQWLNATFQEGNEWAITPPQPLTPGFHIVYAYATSGEDATSTDAGYQTSPVIGAMTSYGFLVAPPLGVLTPGSGLNFGTAQYGSEVGPQTFTLSNEGVGPLVFSDTVVFAGPNSGDFPETAGDTCVQYMSGLAAGTSCTLVLDFMPSGFGTENATATVSTTNSGGIASNLQPIPLTGVSYPYLDLDVSGSGSGTVTDSTNGISCQVGLDCGYDFPVGTQINLTANPGAGYVLDGFTSPCSPSSSTCSFTVTGNNTIGVHFSPASATTYTLTVTELGTGTGTITDGLSSPQQMTCTTAPSPNPVTTCTATINSGQSVTLTATASGSSTFGGWSTSSNYSACTSALMSSTCTINNMTSNMTAGAFFVPPPATATLTYNPVAPSNTAYFNCTPTNPSLPPSPSNPCTNPNAHQVNLAVPAVSTQFNLVVEATEVSPLQADGICETGNTVLNDFDCRFVSFFSGPTVATGVEVPQCDAYANGDCIFYSVYYTDTNGVRTEPDPSWYTPPVTWNIAFNDDNNTPPSGYSSSERLYDDPDYEPSPTSPYGTNCSTPMVTGTPPGVATNPPIECQFEFDITSYFNPTEVVDRGIGGVTQQFNDVVVAFPLSAVTPPSPSLSLTDTPDPSEAPAVAGVSGVQSLTSTGLTIGYTATITNTAAPGSGSANNVALTDTLPNSTGLSWTIASVNPVQVMISGVLTDACSISTSTPQVLTCNFGSISPVVSATVDVVSPSVAGTFSNSVTVTASNNPTLTASSSPITVSTTAFSGLTPSSTITYGAASVALSGVIGSGSLHPPTTESVSVTIDGITTAAAIGAGGTFSVPAFVTSAIPASATPYTITYSYAGDSDFTPATNTSTTLTVKQATATFSAVTASQSITAGAASIALAGTISAGTLYPPAGETVKVTIDGITQSTTTTGTGGTFTLTFTTSAIPASATPYTITYSYAGDTNFTTATNTSTTLAVNSAIGTTTFSSVTASQSITHGAASISLSGTLTSGTKHPPAGETVKVTIDGIAQSTTITGTGGTFTLTFTTSAIPASATPYTITYSYGGDSNFSSATNTATTLTVNKATTTFSAVAASQSITVGAASISLSGTLSSGSLHPPAGETVTVTIDSIIESTTTTGTGGTFTLTFTTSAVPASSTPYTISYSYAGDTNFSSATNTSTTLTVNSATGTGGLTISPTSLAFGKVYLGTIPVKMVTLTNNTTSTVTITSVSLTAVPGADSYDFVGVNLCAKTLAVKKSCQIEMSFIPNSAVNIVQSAILTIVNSASKTAQTVTMNATVINPEAVPSPSSLSFGTVKTGTTSASKTVTVTNAGLTTTTISAVAISGNFALTSASTCKASTTLAAGAKCTLVVTFTPAAKGSRSGTITLTDNALNSPQTIALSGTGD